MAKSSFFETFDATEQDNVPFLKDVARLADVPAGSLPQLLERVPDYIRAGTPSEKRLVIDQASRVTAIIPLEIAYHMRCLETLIAIFSDTNDAVDDVADDLIEIGGLPATLAPALREVLQSVKATALREYMLIDEVTARRGVLPILQRVLTTTELRGVFHETSGAEVFQGFVGIISVNLDFDVGADTYFQCDRFYAEMLIREMQKALQRLESLESLKYGSNGTPSTAAPSGENEEPCTA